MIIEGMPKMRKATINQLRHLKIEEWGEKNWEVSWTDVSGENLIRNSKTFDSFEEAVSFSKRLIK